MPVRADAITYGQSPRVAAITAGALVRKGAGICVGITIGVPAGAGGTIALWDGPVGTGTNIFNLKADSPAGFYPVYQDFKADLNVVVAVAAGDVVIVTGGE